MQIPVSSILYDEKFNCRGRVRPEEVETLAALIKESGLICPITVRPLDTGKYDYQLVCGHRRFIATTQLLGWELIESLVVDCTNEEAARMNLMENLGRQDLTPGQESDGLVAAFGEKPNVAFTAQRLGKSQQWVRRRLALRELDEKVKSHFWDGGLSAFDLSILISCPLDRQQVMVEELLKAKGEGRSSSEVAKAHGKLRRPRSRSQIQEMITRLLDEDVEPTAWKALAWAAGTISDEELLDFDSECGTL